MIFSFLTIALISVTTFFLIVLDNSLGNEPRVSADGYQNNEFYRIMRKASCTVQDPCKKDSKDNCVASLQFKGYSGEQIVDTYRSFSSKSPFAAYKKGDIVDCYVDPYNEKLANYEPITNADPRFLTITLGLIGGSVGLILITLALSLAVTCACARRKSKFTDDDLDRLMAHVNQDDMGPL